MSYATPRSVQQAQRRASRLKPRGARQPRVAELDYNRPPAQFAPLPQRQVIIARGDIFSHKQTVG
jgi:hypothetical protein